MISPPHILTVHGKRNRVRTIPIEDKGARAALTDWLHHRGYDDGPLFTRAKQSGHPINKPITDQRLYAMLAKRGQQAGLKHFTPHDLRRSFAGDLFDAGVSTPLQCKHSWATPTPRPPRDTTGAVKPPSGRHYESCMYLISATILDTAAIVRRFWIEALQNALSLKIYHHVSGSEPDSQARARSRQRHLLRVAETVCEERRESGIRKSFNSYWEEKIADFFAKLRHY